MRESQHVAAVWAARAAKGHAEDLSRILQHEVTDVFDDLRCCCVARCGAGQVAGAAL